LKKEIIHNPAIKILLIILAIALVTPVLVKTIFYWDGLKNQHSWLPILVWSGCVFLQVILLLSLFTERTINSCSKPRSLKKAGINALLVIVALVITIGSILSSALLPAGAEIFLHGFDKWIKKNVDTVSIQNWLETAGEQYFNKSYSIKEGFPQELPEFIVRLHQSYISFNESELDGSKVIMLSWGGGMSHWGVVVGNPEMKMPSEGKIEIHEGFVRFQKPVKAGVYIFDEG
jgi:hypothetical protein